jgi:hypothetical protein
MDLHCSPLYAQCDVFLAHRLGPLTERNTSFLAKISAKTSRHKIYREGLIWYQAWEWRVVVAVGDVCCKDGTLLLNTKLFKKRSPEIFFLQTAPNLKDNNQL